MNIREQLTKPFDPKDEKWRIIEAGKNNNGIWAKVCKYIDARLVQNRLDEVFGWDNWDNEVIPVDYIDNKGKQKSGFISKIIVNFEGKKIVKSDVADLTDFEELKGGASASFKRAASSGFGIGRYLYDEDYKFVKTSTKKDDYYTEYAKLRDGTVYYWALPSTQITKKPSEKKPSNNSYQSVNSKGNKVIIEDTNPIIEDKHIKCIYAKTRNILLNDEEIKKIIKDKFKVNSKKELRIEGFKCLMNYIDTMISTKDHKKILVLLDKKGRNTDELEWFVKKWQLKSIAYMTKKHVNYIIEKLKKLPDKEELEPKPVDEDVKALFATN